MATGVLTDLSEAQRRLSPEAYANLQLWLSDPAYQDFREEITAILTGERWSDLEDAFYTSIPFGTGGRRGPRGAGPNRINRRTIAESAKGLCNWVQADGPRAAARGVVIAYDTRHGSREFAEVCAQVAAAAGVKAHLFDGVRSTPELSFAVRHLNTRAGIVVSASHNPPADNGFKAYGEDGGQLVPPDDTAVMQCVQQAGLSPIPLMDFQEGQAKGLIQTAGPDIDGAYHAMLVGTLLTNDRNVRVVYTPLHGTGATSVLPAFERAGIRDMHVVAEQATPDGDFPNVPANIPNPEVPSALEQAKALAERIDADIALGTDPDADRLGCVARRTVNGSSDYAAFNGNQIGALLCYSVLEQLRRQGRMPQDALVMRTVVTTGLIDRIARRYGVGLINDLLVGFKYVACVLNHLDDPQRFVFATEESHGYLTTPFVRDKDGANAALLVAEIAAGLKKDGRDLWWLLDQVYRQFGYFSEGLENYVRPGKAGQEEIVTMMTRLREQPPAEVAGLPVLEVVDRLTNQVTDVRSGKIRPAEPTRDPKTGAVIEQLQLAKDNLLVFHLGGDRDADGGFMAVRPSGTEPKCKFYVSAHSAPNEGANETDLQALKTRIDDLRDSMKADAVRYATGLL